MYCLDGKKKEKMYKSQVKFQPSFFLPKVHYFPRKLLVKYSHAAAAAPLTCFFFRNQEKVAAVYC